LNELVRVVRNIMENAYKLDIPLTTEARWGTNWDELNPLT
jgi:DNA polymerase-1